MIALAAWLDRQESRLRRGFERAGFSTAWLEEFRTYLNDPRMTLEEFWCRYTLLRMQEGPKLDAVTTEAEARAFYATSEYPLWRNLVHRRHSSWRRVLWTMRGRTGCLMEFGCGVAPVSAYCARYRPTWCYVLGDVPGASREFGTWRVARLTGVDVERDVKTLAQPVSVVTALDVLEHLSHPLDSMRAIVNLMPRGALLHWNFVATDSTGLDLASSQQRVDTIAYLTSALRTHYQSDDHMVSLKE